MKPIVREPKGRGLEWAQEPIIILLDLILFKNE